MIMRGLLTTLMLVAAGFHTPAASAQEPTPTTTSAWCGYFAGSTSYVMPYGATARIGGGVRAGGNPVDGADLQLWAKPYGHLWRQVSSATTTSTGNTSTTHTPRFNTVYKWRFARTTEYAASSSNYASFRVSTKVTIRLTSSTVRAGQSAVAKGRTYPSKPGLVATLWRRLPGYSTRLATTRVGSDGTYRLAHRVSGPARYWLLYVTVAAGTGNAKGTSKDRQVTIT